MQNIDYRCDRLSLLACYAGMRKLTCGRVHTAVLILLCFVSGALFAAPEILDEPEVSEKVDQRMLSNHLSPVSFNFELIARDFKVPWGMAFIDTNSLIITERSGGLYLLDLNTKLVTALSHPLAIYAQSQGGLLDVALPPDSQWIYVTYAKSVSKGQAATALARFQLKGKRAANWQEIIVTKSLDNGGRHFGSRIAFDEAGHVFFSVGDRGHRPNGQDLQTHAGTILRLHLDGQIPKDNPFIGHATALPEIWSYGHRNPQGLFYDLKRQQLWSIEHGPRGGDEINLIQKGGNYGWAVVSHGKEYISPFRVGEATSKPGMIDPVKVYIPSIAPGSLIVYRGDAFPQWQGDLFSGALKLQHINRVRINEKNEAVAEARLFSSLKERIRSITQNTDGWIYFATDNGNIYRLRPSAKP